MDIDRVVFAEMHYLLEVHIDSWKSERYLAERKGKNQEWRFQIHRNLVVGETEGIRFQNADILVDYCDQ